MLDEYSLLANSFLLHSKGMLHSKIFVHFSKETSETVIQKQTMYLLCSEEEVYFWSVDSLSSSCKGKDGRSYTDGVASLSKPQS